MWRVFAGNRHALAELSVERMPHSLAEVVEGVSHDGICQCHTGQAALPGKEGMVFFGQGGADCLKKNELLDFFRAIDRSLQPVLKGQNVPLVFVGVEYLFPIFREVNSYLHVLPEPIRTNPDRLTAAALKEMAEPLLEPYWLKGQREDVHRFNESLGTGRVSANLEEVLQAGKPDAWRVCS